MDTAAVAAIRKRLETRITDLGTESVLKSKPAMPSMIAKDEKRLGFALPSLLKDVFLTIGNGGFGPGYGLIGMTDGAPNDLGQTIPDIYLSFRTPADDGFKWPQALLPICHWGCAILSCVDCAAPTPRMMVFDPNGCKTPDQADAFIDLDCDLKDWIGKWACGIDLWDEMYGPGGSVTRILQARRAEQGA